MDEFAEYDPEFLMADAILGKECENFRDSGVGRYIIGRARQEIQELLEKLVDADPEDKKAQREIRQDMQTRQMMISYLFEQIQNGENSRIQLEENSD